ncbi:MAG: hypothetical protein ABFD97_17450 [Syntrophobacter sp.]
METWSLSTLLIAFGGGIVGAAFGGLWSIIICGFLVFVGCLVVIAGGSDFMLLQVGLGPIFGPHVGGFTAGAAAVCYSVGVKKNHPTGSAKDVLSPLMDTSWDVLLIGGLFALLGHVLLPLIAAIPILNQSDVIAVNVTFCCMLARFLFLKEMPWGKAESIKEHGLLGTGNYAISWAPWQATPIKITVLGLGAGIFGAALAQGLKLHVDPLVAKGVVTPVAAFVMPLIIVWGLALIHLIALQLGTGSIQKVPIWHCQGILGSLGFLLSGSLVVGALAGILGGFLQELAARLTYNHGSSHIDPPVTGIAMGVFILSILFKPQFLNLAALFK